MMCDVRKERNREKIKEILAYFMLSKHIEIYWDEKTATIKLTRNSQKLVVTYTDYGDSQCIVAEFYPNISNIRWDFGCSKQTEFIEFIKDVLKDSHYTVSSTDMLSTDTLDTDTLLSKMEEIKEKEKETLFQKFINKIQGK